MVQNNKIVVVLPAYNAERTLEKTYNEIPLGIVDEVVLVDDKSDDKTVQKAKELGILHVHLHNENKGYGANQKTCYDEALKLGADIVVMLHPDYQYSPKLIPNMVEPISNSISDVVLGSRILKKGALKSGMPLYKYISNRFLTIIQNLLLSTNLSEFHTGYRAYSKKVLQEINYNLNSNDFVFDNQVLAQIHYSGFRISEIACPAKYEEESSSINFMRSVKYGFGVLGTSLKFFIQKNTFVNFKLFNKQRTG